MESKYEGPCDQYEARGQEGHQETSTEQPVQDPASTDRPRHAVQQPLGQAQGGREGGGDEGRNE